MLAIPGEVNMTQIKIICDTTFKLQPVSSSQLSDSQKQRVPDGTLLNVQSYYAVADHIKVALLEKFFKGRNTWFVYQKHAVILKNGNIVCPAEVKLKVPYKSQLDNADNPYGSCNTTSVAMTLSYFGVTSNNPDEQLEDELQDWLEARGLDRHEPTHLAQAVEAYGCHDNFKTNATIQEVKEWLVQGNPAIVHGYFTASGHVVCLIGYNSQGLIVNDPYGEYYADGYDTSASGSGLVYSYDMIQNTCMSDGNFWVHFISK